MAEYIVKETGYPGELKQEVAGELIRCKECIYGRPVDGDEKHRVVCEHGINSWEEVNIHGVNWYCADAERREDG